MAVQFHAKGLFSLLICPLGGEPLTQAVALWPCLDKVNQVAAEKYFGKIVDGVCEFERRCVVCNYPVFSYGPDLTVRDIARHVFGYGQALEALPTYPLRLAEKEQEINLPYPGVPANFVQTVDRWDQPFESESDLCRNIRFKSTTENSLLTEFNLLGYWNGDVNIAVDFKRSDSFKEYLYAHRCFCDRSETFYMTRTVADLKTIFRIIALNNEIPPEQFDKVRRIVERGYCDPC